jgi:hypothetical protein
VIPTLTPELQAILDEAMSRGTLVDGHPDLKPKVVEVGPPQIVAVRSVHQPLRRSYDWRTAKVPEPTGYSNPVDDPEWNARFAFKP